MNHSGEFPCGEPHSRSKLLPGFLASEFTLAAQVSRRKPPEREIGMPGRRIEFWSIARLVAQLEHPDGVSLLNLEQKATKGTKIR